MKDLAWESAPFDALTVLLTDGQPIRVVDQVADQAAAAWMAVIGERLSDAARIADAALLDAERSSHRLTVTVRALRMIIAVLRGDGQLDHDLLDALEQQLAATTAEVLADRLWALLEIPNWFTFADRYDDAGRLVVRAVQAARDGDDQVALVWSLCCQAELDLRRGRWSQCRAALTEALARSRSQDMAAGYLHVLAARLEASIGNADAARHHLASSRTDAYDRGDRSSMWRAEAVEGLLALAEGDLDHASAVLGRLGRQQSEAEATAPHAAPREAGGGPALASVRWWDGDLLEVLVRTGELEDARAVLKRLCSEPSSPWSSAMRLRGEAMLAEDPLDGIEHAVGSAECFERFGAPFERARSELIAGELARRARRARQARDLLRRAATTFDALGATAWSQRAGRELRACGGTIELDAGGRTAACAGLTDQEREIALAVAAGASNREVAAKLFISVKTVETHLTRAYRKLGVSSRTQLAATLADAGSLD